MIPTTTWIEKFVVLRSVQCRTFRISRTCGDGMKKSVENWAKRKNYQERLLDCEFAFEVNTNSPQQQLKLNLRYQKQKLIWESSRFSLKLSLRFTQEK